MDHDISRWLKNDLGLVHMSECDLNSLMFHPRHGTLCRRLIKFLAESTLCKERYPNVFAQEESLKATEELERASEKLYELSLDLEDVCRDSENVDNELNFMNAKLKHLQEIRELQKVSLTAFDEMANRSNMGIEQMYRNNQDLDYLTNSSLEHVYSIVDTNNMDPITNSQITAIDAELSCVKEDIDSVHSTITELFQSINDKRDKMEINLRPIRADFQDLVALKLPEFEEVTLEINDDEKKLKDINEDLSKQVYELDQQVAELSRQYKTSKAKIEKNGIAALCECLAMLEDLNIVTSVTKGYSSNIIV